jgi:hypothetical protein
MAGKATNIIEHIHFVIYRSACKVLALIIGEWRKLAKIISKFYFLTSGLHTNHLA